MWQSSKAICIGQMRLMSLCCLEGSTMSNLVHRRRRCARMVPIWYSCLEGSTPQDGFFFYHGLNGLDGLNGFTLRGDCALMRPIGPR